MAAKHKIKKFVAGFGSMFRIFTLRDQVVNLMKNEQQSQHLLLKVDPRSTFRNNFLQPTTNSFVAGRRELCEK